MALHKSKPEKSGQAKRLETLEAETIKQKTEFLEHLSKSSIVQLACERSGVGRSTYYDWRSKDKEFAELADRAKEAGEFLVNDIAESKLIQNIQNNQNTAIIFWLKNHHAKYNERIYHQHELINQQEITEEEKTKIDWALRNIGLANILRMNSNMTLEEWKKAWEKNNPNDSKGKYIPKKPVIDPDSDDPYAYIGDPEPEPPSKVEEDPIETKPQVKEVPRKKGGVNIEEFLAKRKKLIEDAKKREGK